MPPKDFEPLADAIETLLENGELRQKMGRTGREKAIQDFDVKDVVRKTLDVYTQMGALNMLKVPNLTTTVSKGDRTSIGLKV